MIYDTGECVWVKMTELKERMGIIVRTCPNYMYEISLIGLNKTDFFHEKDIRIAGAKSKSKIDSEVALKNDSEKNRLELIPHSAIEGLGRAMTYGSQKYEDHNWSNGFNWDRLVGSLMRHLNAWRAGQDNDPESGLSHIDHVLANAAMLAAHIEEGLGNDNRRKSIK